jgi:hypothetical protein
MPLVAPVQPLEEAGAGSKRRPLPELETAGNGRTGKWLVMSTQMRQILLEENPLCDLVCRIYCRSMAVVMAIGLVFCL